MQSLHDAAQLVLQILSSPAWSGISSLCSLIGIPLAILLARQPKINQPQEPRVSRKNQARRLMPSNEPRLFIRDGYHRVTLAKEIVKDVDILVVVDS